MGLRSVPSKVAPADARIDISSWGGEGAYLEFRAPKLADYMPSAAAVREVAFAFPGFPDTLVRQVLLMGACYIRQEGDPADLAPVADMARIADTNAGAFMHILNGFSEAFPEDFAEAKADAKNDSGVLVAPSSTTA